MNEKTAIQLISRAMGATVDIVEMRDPADGSRQHAIRYACGESRWISTRRFEDREQANIAAIAVADFSGADYRA